MGIMDKIFGREEEPEQARSPVQQGTTSAQPVGGSPDEQALTRYRYMLQTAPPETIEQAHAEAFAKLTPEQRRMVLQNLTASAPEAERTGAKDDPQSLARMATRAEIRQPGTMERTFGGIGGMSGGMGMGGMMAGSFLSSIAGVVVGSAIAQSFFGSSGFDGGADSGGNMQSAGESEANQDANQNSGNEVAADSGGDVGGGFDDFGGGDLGDF